MSSPTDPSDDAFWRRPEHDDDAGPGLHRPPPAATPTPPAYAGPPQPPPPSPQWRPPVVAQPPPPRSLPGQDIDALEEAEGSARTVTYGIGMVAAAITVIVVCLLCSRLLF